MTAYDGVPHTTVSAGSTMQWRDRKRYLWLIGLVVPSLAFIALGMWSLTGWGVWFWIGPIVILVVVPAIDLIAGLDRSNPPDDVIEALEKDRYYRWITYLFLPIQYAGFVGALWVMTHDDLAVADRVGIAVSIGCIGGIGINTAHELGHKKESHERWLSKIALAQSFYGHFYIEHNRGHHVRVATPEDPASARVGESFYQFWPRTVAGSLRSAWNLEKRRIARRRQHPWRLSNDVLNAWLMSAVLWGAMIAFFGIGIAPYLVIQAVVGFSLLEVVNYMEHYGMLRQKVGVGERQRYERVDPSHSWNSNNIATNVLLYHLQRHSDHHANPTRRYQSLRDFEESPVLPTGYAGMIVLAVVPAIWRRVMDPRVCAHFGGDMSRANISPRKRDRILARDAARGLDTGSPGGSPGSTTETLGDRAASASETQGGSETSGGRAVSAGEALGGRAVSAGEALGGRAASAGEAVGGRAASAGEALGGRAVSASETRGGSEALGGRAASASERVETPPDEALVWRCPGCDYTYDVVAGDEREGFAAGTAWSEIPDSWCCPDCGVREKVDFVADEAARVT